MFSKENRGKKPLSTEIKQQVYDAWISNSIPSTDNRNARSKINISKLQFIKKFGSITHEDGLVEERKNKRGNLQWLMSMDFWTAISFSILQQVISSTWSWPQNIYYPSMDLSVKFFQNVVGFKSQVLHLGNIVNVNLLAKELSALGISTYKWCS